MSRLMERWLQAVNQRVANDVAEKVSSLMASVSDGGNFSPEECQSILAELAEEGQ